MARKTEEKPLEPLRAYLNSIGDSLVIGESDDAFAGVPIGNRENIQFIDLLLLQIDGGCGVNDGLGQGGAVDTLSHVCVPSFR